MKNIHIIAILMIVIAAGILISMSGDVSSYATFDQALSSGDRVKIAGELSKDKEIKYNPEEDPNLFSFFLKDSGGAIKKVVLNQPKPMDFERSESIVVTGELKEDIFYANDILLKCPSKYKTEEMSIKANG